MSKLSPGTFACVSKGFALDLELSKTALRVGLFIAAKLDKKGECGWSTGGMARELKISRASVVEAIKQLIKRDHLERRRGVTKGRGKGPSIYKLVYRRTPDGQTNRASAPGPDGQPKPSSVSDPMTGFSGADGQFFTEPMVSPAGQEENLSEENPSEGDLSPATAAGADGRAPPRSSAPEERPKGRPSAAAAAKPRSSAKVSHEQQIADGLKRIAWKTQRPLGDLREIVIEWDDRMQAVGYDQRERFMLLADLITRQRLTSHAMEHIDSKVTALIRCRGGHA